MNPLMRLKPNPVSIDLGCVTVFEMNYLLSNNPGYIDGDKRTLEIEEVRSHGY